MAVQTKIRVLRNGFLLLLFLLLGMFCATAMGHEWTIDGKKVEAKVVNYNQSHVLLEDNQGRRKSFAINSLNAEDLQYLTNLATIQQGEQQRVLAQQQLQQQQALLLSQYVDVWTVWMFDRNGRYGSRNYFATNSAQAIRLALQEFPQVRVSGVQRLRRPGVSGGSNLGLAPVINRFPNISTLSVGR
ncbi:MAG: hypothetical protein AAFN77_16515 [Planctomycetota bacterium]